jgi:FPC/CPF motif-containing protein YcgG
MNEQLMSEPKGVAAAPRGKAAIEEMRDLLSQYLQIQEDILTFEEGPVTDHGIGPSETIVIMIKHEEVLEVLNRRLAVVSNMLKNKGIEVKPEPGF